MKKIIIGGLVCVLLALALAIPVVAKSKPKSPVYITNEEKLYQFQRPSKDWKEQEPGKFNDYWFFHHRHQMTSIFIGSLIYTTELEDLDLFATQHSWIITMRKKYKFKSVKIIEEDSVVINECPAVWSVIEFEDENEGGRQVRKEKIYLVKGDKFYYRLRISCPERYFDKHLEEFEQLVKSFEILKETPDPDEEAADESKGN